MREEGSSMLSPCRTQGSRPRDTVACARPRAHRWAALIGAVTLSLTSTSGADDTLTARAVLLQNLHDGFIFS
jgi:hypothetical protein